MTTKEAFQAGAAAAVKTFSAPKMPTMPTMKGLAPMSGKDSPLQAANNNLLESTVMSTGAQLAQPLKPALV